MVHLHICRSEKRQFEKRSCGTKARNPAHHLPHQIG
jgi:hypothetical protein